MATSHIDSTDYGKGLQKALVIRGVRQVPDEINVDQIQVTADSVQAGHAIKDWQMINDNYAFTAPAGNQTYWFLSPDVADYPDGNVQNNREYESRLLGMQAVINVAAEVAGEWLRVSVQFYDVAQGLFTPIIEARLEQKAGILSYLVNFPFTVTDQTGSFQLYGGHSWNGYIPAGLAVMVRVYRQNNFQIGDNRLIKATWVRVPRGAHLPL